MPELNFDAVIFDMDGVVTNTAKLHCDSWKLMFDNYLRFRENQFDEAFREFTHKDDYLPFVDGKPRYSGVESFLKSRKISLSWGEPDDGIDDHTICGLGNEKNRLFGEMLNDSDIEVFESTVKLINELRSKGIRIGLASSSKNAEAVLRAGGLKDLFETVVDGVVSAREGLSGKPSPDIFTFAADRLAVNYDRAVVVEDAASGVKAGKNGNFGYVIGIAREDNEQTLRENGADIVVRDLREISIADIVEWFEKGRAKDSWNVCMYGYDSSVESVRESLFTVGNGYFGTRGAFEECFDDLTHYPATYAAGIYNRACSNVFGKEVSNEDFVRLPDWTSITFKIGTDGSWFSSDEVVMCERKLDMKKGLYTRIIEVQDSAGRRTRVESCRVASQSDMQTGALQYTIIPLNHQEKIFIRSELNGDIINNGVKRYRKLDSKHLDVIDCGYKDGISYMNVKTRDSGTEVKMGVKEIFAGAHAVEKSSSDRKVFKIIEFDTRKKKPIIFGKIFAMADSNTPTDDPAEVLIDYKTFQDVLEPSVGVWGKIWERADIKIEGDRLVQKLVRFNIYHLFTTFSVNNYRIDAGIPARGLHGEAYRGHIFWDELFIIPFYNITFPEIAVSAINYRYNRLEKARELAQKQGYSGALFPWQSGSSGGEETQQLHLNPMSGKWDPDWSYLQRHVSLAIAYNTIRYFHETTDICFIEQKGLELLLEICRFWASVATVDETDGKWHINGVMGPDEYHEKYPEKDTGGLNDNSYTNLMVAWVLKNATCILYCGDVSEAVKLRLDVSNDELEKWENIIRNIYVEVSEEGIIAQYKGYFNLEELDWRHYREKYGDIHRMDRIMKAEGLNPDSYKVSKQADALMTYFNLGKNQVDSLLDNIGINPPSLSENFDYYMKRTSHGSTLSKIVHASIASLIGRRKVCMEFFLDALRSDYQDIQGGTTAEGIHTGVMAGCLMVVLNSFTGVNTSGEILKIEPALPGHWQNVTCRVLFKGIKYDLTVKQEELDISVEGASPVKVMIKNIKKEIKPGKKYSFKYLNQAII